jgi:hypothetical protein
VNSDPKIAPPKSQENYLEEN